MKRRRRRRRRRNQKLEDDDDDGDKWSRTPDEIKELIFNRLPVADFLRLASTSTSWRSVLINRRPRSVPRQIPWYLNTAPLHCYTLPASNPAALLLPDSLRRRPLIGASHGWLIIANFSVDHTVSLFNPISKELITVPRFPRSLAERPSYWLATLSSHPQSPNSTMVLLDRYHKTAAVCTVSGSKEWRVLLDKEEEEEGEPKFDPLHSVVFHNSRLYTLRWQRDMNKVMALKFDHPPLVTDTFDHLPLEDKDKDNIVRRYLVESGGELVLVVVCTTSFKEYQLYVFEFDEYGPGWKKIKSLGDRTLFLSGVNSESVSASELEGSGFRSNAIYFECGYRRKVRVFSMEDGKEEVTGLQFPYLGLVWFMPTAY